MYPVLDLPAQGTLLFSFHSICIQSWGKLENSRYNYLSYTDVGKYTQVSLFL